MCTLCGPEPGLVIIDHSITHPFVKEPNSDNDCETCGEHLAKHPDKIAYLQRLERERIMEYGHEVRMIFPAAGTDDPDARPFWYSVGRSIFERPELLVTGGLDAPVGQYIINEAARLDLETPIEAGQMLEGVINFPLKVIACDPEAAQMFGATKFGVVTALQLLWPDAQGHYPDEPEYNHKQMPQPMHPKES